MPEANDQLTPNFRDTVRQINALMSLTGPSALGITSESYNTPVVGTSEQEESQMRQFDERAESKPTEIVDNGIPTKPQWRRLLATLPPNAVVYESRYLLDSVFRFDTSITAGGTSATLQLPVIPQGKSALLDEIHVAQISGAGSSPNGYLTDVGVAQLFAVITPDGSTFGASYKSGRNVIPGGVTPLVTLQSLVASAVYLIGVQYQLRTKIDLPQFDLGALFGKEAESAKISDDGFEASDVVSDNTKADMRYGGPYDFSGMFGE